jgi:predicted transcriptional regulator
MAGVAESTKLVDGIVRLRRAERIPEVAPVRRELEARLGPTLSRSRSAQILGVSQTALDRWVAARQVPIVLTPHGRREVPRQFVIELRESIDELLREGRHRRVLAEALKRRREAAAEIGGSGPAPRQRASRGHRTAERRALAYHRLIAERLDGRMVEEARERVERLAADGHLHPRYAERWRALLAEPVGEVAAAIVADTPAGRDLRQNSPFAGVLNEQERRRIIETVR